MRHMPTSLGLLSLVAALGLSACATDTDGRYAGAVQPLDEDSAVHCQLIEELSSSSGLVGFLGPKGVDNIKQNLLRQADALGATHVVWGQPVVGYDSTSLKAMAVRCPAALR